MNEFANEIDKALIKESIDDNEFSYFVNNFLPNLKRCVEKNDFESFNVMMKFFVDYSFPQKSIQISEIRKYLYEMILDEKYEFMKDWTDLEFVTIANPIIFERMESFFNAKELEILTAEDKKNMKDSFELIHCEFGWLVLSGMLKDELYFDTIKRRIETYIYYSLFSLEIMTDTVMSIRGTGRDWIPNRKYTDDMFEYATSLYNDNDKRLKQDEVILDTLKEYKFPIDKFDSFRVRWGIYKRNKIKRESNLS